MNLQRRQAPRVNLGPEYTLRFTAGGHAFQGIRIANLSEGGCFITVPRSDAGVFRVGVRIEQLRLEGPGLPGEPLAGVVAYAMGASPGHPVVGVGVSFLNPTESVQAALIGFMEGLLGRG